MKIIYVILFVIAISCKKSKSTAVTNKKDSDTISNSSNNNKIVESKKSILFGTGSFEKVINSIKEVNNTGDLYTDWTSNGRAVKNLLELGHTKGFKNLTTSYTYKEKCIFYLHTISHSNYTIELETNIRKAEGKIHRNKLSERILIFSMKNEKEAHYIDIPPNWGYAELRKELIDTIYKKIDFVVLSCDTTKVCTIKDLRK